MNGESDVLVWDMFVWSRRVKWDLEEAWAQKRLEKQHQTDEVVWEYSLVHDASDIVMLVWYCIRTPIVMLLLLKQVCVEVRPGKQGRAKWWSVVVFQLFSSRRRVRLFLMDAEEEEEEEEEDVTDVSRGEVTEDVTDMTAGDSVNDNDEDKENTSFVAANWIIMQSIKTSSLPKQLFAFLLYIMLYTTLPVCRWWRSQGWKKKGGVVVSYFNEPENILNCSGNVG